MGFEIDPSYNEVADRIREFRVKHPEGSLDALDRDKPYEIVEVQGKTFVVVASAAYRSPEDPHPGVGLAWEPFPGRTPYTRDSEMQNAQTSSWGRAIVAALAADTKHVASANEVRNRRADQSPALGPAPERPDEGQGESAAPPASPNPHAAAIRAMVRGVPSERKPEIEAERQRRGLKALNDPTFDAEDEAAATELIMSYLERAESEAT